MKGTDNSPETVRRYLCAVPASLAPLPSADRRGVLHGTAGHHEEALQRAPGPRATIPSLGSPAQPRRQATPPGSAHGLAVLNCRHVNIVCTTQSELGAEVPALTA